MSRIISHDITSLPKNHLLGTRRKRKQRLCELKRVTMIFHNSVTFESSGQFSKRRVAGDTQSLTNAFFGMHSAIRQSIKLVHFLGFEFTSCLDSYLASRANLCPFHGSIGKVGLAHRAIAVLFFGNCYR